jgi:hypothetical protein
MTFPATPLGIVVELLIDGAWTDITADVYVRDGVNITRAKQDEGAAQPSMCSMTLNNRLGKYSPRNPLGPYYGKIGRNTQVRVSVGAVRRFWGEVSAWPTRWDTSGADAHVPIECAGLLRRIGQGSQPVSGALKGYLLSTSPITYWPLDDGEGSTTGAPAAGTYTSYRWTGTAATIPRFGVGDLGVHLSPTLLLDHYDAGTGPRFYYGYCFGTDVLPDSLAWEFVYKTDTQIAAGTEMAAWSVEPRLQGTTLGTVDIWKVQFRPSVDVDIRLQVIIDSEGETPTTVNLADSAPLDAITDGELHHVRLQLTENGTGVDYAVYVDGVSVLSGTRASHTLRWSRSVDVLYPRLATEDLMAFGHLIVWENAANIPPLATTSGLAHGFAGETAGARFTRLCDEFGVPSAIAGSAAATSAMGLQYEDYFSNQLTEIEATDHGILYEPTTSLALTYRTLADLYNQAPAAVIDFSAGQLSTPFEPVEDDQQTRNDVFAQRREGSSYQMTLESGPLSVQDPPDGVGRYKDEVQVNVESDNDLPPHAGWLLGLGTVDEARYPRITVDLASAGVAGTALSTDIPAVDIGDLIRVTDTGAIGIYDDISLLVLGYTEVMGAYEWRITFNCSPYSPYQVLEMDDADSRIDPGDDSELDGGVTSTATTLSVDSSTGGFLWTTEAGDMPVSIMVGGEEMTVTAIAGLGVQAFTVVRSVNGVVKAHANGTSVRLKRPGVLAL